MAPADPSAKLGLSLDAIIAQSSRPGGRSGGSRGFSGRAHALSDFDSDAGEHREREPAPAPSGGGGGGGSGRKVFVANLNYQTEWQHLKDHFKSIGNVTYANVMRDGPGDRARSKGCGIVEFESPSDAQAAISQLNESELDGRNILVREDRGGFQGDGDSPPRRARGEYGDRGDRGDYGRRERSRSPMAAPADMQCYECGEYGHRARDCPNRGQGGGRGFQRREEGSRYPPRSGRQIVVHGLPYSFSWQDLKDLANETGGAVKADINEDRATGRSRGFGTVLFETAEQATAAIEALSGHDIDGRTVSAKMDEYA
jgi:RNA recognition motif-containing protein